MKQDKEKDRSGKQSGDGNEVSRPADATIMGSLLKSFFNDFFSDRVSDLVFF